MIGLFGSFIGILLCLPFLWWWIFIINLFVTKGHPIFVHKRIGYHKKEFGLIKFRSMRIDANPYLCPNKMTPEIQKSMETKFGRFLRITSLDETLQLINIFIGQMSFIGPRPGAAINEVELIEIREKYSPNAFDVKPGLSGLAQIKMRRNHDLNLKAQYDHEYALKLSLGLDIKIFFLTIGRIFIRTSGAR